MFRVLAALALFLSPAAAHATARMAEVEDELARIELRLAQVQAETDRAAEGFALAQADPPVGQQRLNDIENSLRQLTGELERLQFEIRQLKDWRERFERDVQYRLLTLENGGTPPETGSLPPGIDTPPPQGEFAIDTTPPGLGPQAGTSVPLPPQEGSSLPQGQLGQLTTPGPTGGAAALYEEGMDLLSRAQYQPALAIFQQIIQQYPDTEQGQQARFWSADIEFVLKNFPVAARGYAEMLKADPTSPRAPDAMLKLGLSLLQMGQTTEGCTTLAALPQQYPNAGDTIKQRARREAQRAGCR